MGKHIVTAILLGSRAAMNSGIDGAVGWALSLATLPGVVLHELAHLIACRSMRIKVHKVCYFRCGSPAGYIIHAKAATPYQQILVGMGPFLLNSSLACLMAVWIAGHGTQMSASKELLLLWLSVSFAVQALPSLVDAREMWNSMWSAGTPMIARLLSTPFVALAYVGAIGSRVGLSYAYAWLIVFAMPRFILQGS